MGDFYVHHIQPIDDRTNVVVIGRRSTGMFQGIRVRLWWWDRLLRRTLLDKTIIVYARAERACDEANKRGE